MYIWEELDTRLITVFGTAQGFRGAFGANPCGLYRMHTRYLIDLVGIIWFRPWGPWEKNWCEHLKEIYFVYCYQFLVELGNIYIYIYSNDNDYKWLSIVTTWTVIIFSNAQRKELSNIEITKVNPVKKHVLRV